jgi:hypothetical protein
MVNPFETVDSHDMVPQSTVEIIKPPAKTQQQRVDENESLEKALFTEAPQIKP